MAVCGDVCRDGEIVAEAINRVAAETDVSRHAETIAMSDAQRLLGSLHLKGCTLYTTVEPCVMCSWTVRMTRIPRVVFAIKSPVMGGHSGWNVLADAGLREGCRSISAVPRGGVPGSRRRGGKGVVRLATFALEADQDARRLRRRSGARTLGGAPASSMFGIEAQVSVLLALRSGEYRRLTSRQRPSRLVYRAPNSSQKYLKFQEVGGSARSFVGYPMIVETRRL